MEKAQLINLILCGGVGSRLWPLSRKLLPKQFSRILKGRTLFERTVERNRRIAGRIMIAANRHQAFLAFNQMEGLGIHEHSGLIEPMGRNTAPAMALAAMLAGPDAIILATPSDHVIADEDAYTAAVAKAARLALDGRIVTFGIKPEYPETGFGYIEGGKEPYSVKAFREKPDEATAASYVAAGNYYWNSGMFCFRAGVFLEELARFAPEVHAACLRAFENSDGIRARESGQAWQPDPADMEAIPSISVDYAVMEKSDRIAVVPCSIGWSDLGSLDALYDFYRDGGAAVPATGAAGLDGGDSRSRAGEGRSAPGLSDDPDRNSSASDIEPVYVDSRRNLVIAGARQVALIDVDDLLVVESPDALLVAKRGSSQKVKQVVQALEEREGKESRLTERFPTIERPWGKYTTLHDGGSYMVRRIEIKPGARTSMQRHSHREEHWTVVSGCALVQIEKSRKQYYPGQGVEVPMGAFHRLENPADETLIIIETQLAAGPVTADEAGKPHLDEGDVERREDDYAWLR